MWTSWGKRHKITNNIEYKYKYVRFKETRKERDSQEGFVGFGRIKWEEKPNRT